MSTYQYDSWRIRGTVMVNHDLWCSCDIEKSEFFEIDETAYGPDAYQAEIRALVAWSARHNLDGSCVATFSKPPTISNTSKEERDREKLRSWNAGEPVFTNRIGSRS